MPTRDRLIEFAFLALVCGVAAWGVQFLPADDYQPSRPLYAGGWLVIAGVLLIVTRNSGTWLSSASKALTGIFALVVALSLAM
jgi:hypothetical protein